MSENKLLQKKRKGFKLFKVEKKIDSKVENETNSNTKIKDIKIVARNELEDEFDYCQKYFRDKISELCYNFPNLNSDYTYYCYNDLKELKNNKEFNEEIKRVINDDKNKDLLKEITEFINRREVIIEKILSKEEKRDLKWYIEYTQNEANINCINELSGETRFTDEYNDLKKEERDEIFIAALIDCSFKKTKKAEEDFDTSINKNMNKNYEIKIEAQNFNFQQSSFIAFFSGIKFNNNIIVINLNGNELKPKACFCLGNIFKYNKHLELLSLLRCSLNNLCLKALILGATHANENLNKEPIYIDHIILKDNDHINDEDNNGEYSLSLLLEKFRIKKLNLANTKIGGKGLKKICTTILYLLNNDNANFVLETLNLFNTGLQNEESLELLGDAILKSKINTLILNKNNISNIPQSEKNEKSINYFAKFMDKIAKSKNLKELLLLKCNIGKNKNDVDILCKMLEENQNLESLRMFDNSISDFDDFIKILNIFSEYKNNELKNKTLKSLDLSKNFCNIRINDDFLNMIDYLNLEYLDINQNPIEEKEKEIFRKRTNTLEKIKIIY